ncbi:MAG: hypothetical protein AAB433_01590 [Nitrospirota bacterium]
MKTPNPTPTPLLPFQLDPEPATETLTAFGGLPLVAQTCRSLGLPQSVARHLRLKQRQRGVDEATMIESFILLNAAGGDCLEDFRRLAEDPSLPTLLGYALPLPDTAAQVSLCLSSRRGHCDGEGAAARGPSGLHSRGHRPVAGLGPGERRSGAGGGGALSGPTDRHN